MQMSNERNKILKQSHTLTRIDTALNIKGKKMQLCRDTRNGLSEERRALRALKKEPDYDSDDSEAVETKESIEQYKRASEDALRDLQNATAPVDEEATVPSRIGTEEKSNGTPENSTLGDDDDQSHAGAGSASATV